MTNTTLKLIAMALMLLDHLHTFLPDMPLWFTWLGRISAPLFIFSMTARHMYGGCTYSAS